RLPGLGAYLQTAAGAGDLRAVLAGVGTLVVVIVLLDQLVWRPVLAWADRFKVEMSASEQAPRSWFLDALRGSWLAGKVSGGARRGLLDRLDAALSKSAAGEAPGEAPPSGATVGAGRSRRVHWALGIVAALVLLAVSYGA